MKKFLVDFDTLPEQPRIDIILRTKNQSILRYATEAENKFERAAATQNPNIKRKELEILSKDSEQIVRNNALRKLAEKV